MMSASSNGSATSEPATPKTPVRETPVREIPVRDRLFTLEDPPRLLASSCGGCGQAHFPRGDVCPYCSTEGCGEIELSSSGVLWSWTAVTSAPPGYKGEVPYGFGVVELPEGIRVVTRLSESDPTRLFYGERVQMEIVALYKDDEGNDVVTFSFAPDRAAR